MKSLSVNENIVFDYSVVETEDGDALTISLNREDEVLASFNGTLTTKVGFPSTQKEMKVYMWFLHIANQIDNLNEGVLEGLANHFNSGAVALEIGAVESNLETISPLMAEVLLLGELMNDHSVEEACSEAVVVLSSLLSSLDELLEMMDGSNAQEYVVKRLKEYYNTNLVENVDSIDSTDSTETTETEEDETNES